VPTLSVCNHPSIEVAALDQSVNNLTGTVFADAERLGQFGVGHKTRLSIFREAGNLGQQDAIHGRKVQRPNL
jgi:hypothetical protein